MERFNFQQASAVERAPIQEMNPIKDGEVFDPEIEVSKILKTPTSERKNLLRQFKEKMDFQKNGLSEMQKLILREIMENPDISQRELLIKTEPFVDKFGFSEGQIERIHNSITSYESMHDAVSGFVSENPSSKQACKKLFGIEPEGEVEMMVSPMTIHFRFHDFMDFVRAKCDNPNSRLQVNKEAEQSIGINGLHFYRDSFGKLKNSIVLENISERSGEAINRTSSHELQHAISDFHHEMITGKLGENNPYAKKEEYLWDAGKQMLSSVRDENALRQGMTDYFRFAKIKAMTMAQEEIISWLSTGSPVAGMGEIIRDYSHAGNMRRIAGNTMKDLLRFYGGKFSNFNFGEIMNDIVGDEDFYSTIDSALEAVKKAKDSGISREDIIARVRTEPITKWSREINRWFKAVKTENSNA